MRGSGGKVAQIHTSGSEHRYESLDERAIVLQLLAGHSVYMVAFAFDITPRKVRRIARKHGINVP